ncbi:glycerol-1-phosphate dehydrogenase [NAD(P)+] [Lachnotalea glycerini]|uniref:Glycerol-1-phosphate dehydrogenase [NAD(P)+] n=1 Tax=Lachnotalea glycerini TaxID=1763509 RepID=A0A255I9M5_9FIRM|nr:sn-glycerol-1-phosphate dehydrogenase [Lachnotalea glycerini]PXV88340.1 glycerol-1-phosphate dehydrogenase [NAD(P)+] [Lachnotalea glycerini]RDY26971.1 sn-glycerol-1-phosphate dehydrogenase [Lachnotalea glycerini]
MDIRNWNDYLNTDIECNCGKTHRCDIDKIIIEEGAISKLSEIIMSGFYHNTCVVCDSTTEEAAGRLVYQELRSNLIQFEPIILRDKEPIADEKSIGDILVHIAPKCDLIIAVGSGTINDLCKFISYKMGIDYIIVATAPSMDGYASNVSALIVNHLKCTYEVGRPKAIIADTNILAEAPFAMITAGVGDILGKYVCLADWKLSNIVTGEYYCCFVEALVRDSLEMVVAAISKINERDKDAITAIMEALVLSGIAMSYIGNSRPASGSEHHLSHFWELSFLQSNRPCALHGTKVAVGTVIALKLYERLNVNSFRCDCLSAPNFNEEKWKESINKVYGLAAKEVIELEESVHKNSNDEVQLRRDAIYKHSNEIHMLIDKLPDSEEIKQLLDSIFAPYLPKQIQVDDELVSNAILYAKELRNRYGILQLLFDIDELEKFALYN